MDHGVNEKRAGGAVLARAAQETDLSGERRSSFRRTTYKVIQWGTGNVGRHALRAIISRPDLELAGVLVYSEEKSGVDAGDLIGGAETGIRATNSVEEILAIEADCVNYNALGTTEEMYGQPLDDICMLLSRGYNVTTTAIDAFVYLASAPPQHVQRLEQAAAEGGSSFFGSGIDPGFTHDFFPIVLTRLSRQVDRIRALEVCNMRDLSSASTMGFMGFGKEPSAPSALDEMHSDPTKSVFYTCMRMVADALRFDLDEYRYEREVGLTEVPVETAIGTIAPGTIAAVKMTICGVAFGRDVLQFEWVWRVSDDVRPEWGTGEFWEHEIDGDPWIRNRLEAGTTFDAKRIVSITVATTALNGIPTVCEAPPGVYDVMSLPNWAGGFVGPAVVG